MLIFEGAANRWLERPRVRLGVAVANSMVMTFYLWNMTAAVLAAVLLLPTGIAPQPEPLTAAAAFPVQGEVLAMPALGVASLALGALLLRANPLSPLAKSSTSAR